MRFHLFALLLLFTIVLATARMVEEGHPGGVASTGPVPPSELVLNSIPDELLEDQLLDGPRPVEGTDHHTVVYRTAARTSVGEGPTPANTDRDLVLVLVEEDLFPDLNASLTLYAKDLEMCEYDVKVIKGDWNRTTTVRDLLKAELANGLVGALLVGDIVEAWCEILDGDASWGVQEFPTDLYYMDLDGTWADFDGDSMYEIHMGNVEPEIWIGRLKPSVLGDEVDLLTNYFRKNHDYRTGNLTLPHRSLVYVDEDWTTWSNSWNASVGRVYSDSTLINDSRGDATNKDDYLDRLDDDYEWVHVCVHSGQASHWFKVNGEFLSSQRVTTAEIEAVDPHVHFYNLWACSNARYTAEDCMGSQYVFSDTYGLLAIGSTKTGGMIEPDSFYEPLSGNISIGEAFREWFDDIGENDRNWTYGMVILGDPTLTTIHDLHAMSPEVRSPTHPDQEAAYSSGTVLFEWDTPLDLSGVAGYYYCIDNSPVTVPDPESATWTTSNNATFNRSIDGYWYFHIVTVDVVGNIARVPYHFGVIIDTTPPTASIVLEDDDEFTTDLDVLARVDWDDMTPVRLMRFSQDGISWGEWINTTHTWEVRLDPLDGERTVHFQVMDMAGLVSGGNVSDSIILDTTPPSGTIAARTSDGYSNVLGVIVDITGEDANGVVSMRLSDDGMVWGAWKGFVTSTRWTVAEGDGPKEVHLQLMDAAGLVSVAPINTTFLLDTKAPTVGMTINGGGVYTTDPTLTLDVQVADEGPIDWIRHAITGGDWTAWTPFNATFVVSLSGEDGMWQVRVEVRDRAANTCTEPASASIILDTTPPSGTILLDDGAIYTTDPTVNVSVMAGDANGVPVMSLRTDDGDWGDWTPLVSDLELTLPGGDGAKEVHVRLKDAAGLVSLAEISDSIILDTTPPDATASLVGPDGYYSRELKVTIALADFPQDDAREMRYRLLDGEWSGWVPFEPLVELQLGPLDGPYAYHFVLRDDAGLETPKPIDVTIFLDTRDPEVEVLGHPDGWLTRAPDDPITLRLDSVDGGSPLTSYETSYDGGSTWTGSDLAGAWVAEVRVPIDFALLVEGTTTIMFRLTDQAGNVGMTEVGLHRDTLAPTVSLGPTSSRSDAPEVRVSWECQDDTSGLVRLLLYLDGGDPVDVTNRSGIAFDDLLNGHHDLRLVATDGAGNEAEAHMVVTVEAGIMNNSWSGMMLLSLVALVATVSLITLLLRHRRGSSRT